MPASKAQARTSLAVLQTISGRSAGARGLLTLTIRSLDNQRFGFETQGPTVVRVKATLADNKTEKLYGL
jgi:hypothetical protein